MNRTGLETVRDYDTRVRFIWRFLDLHDRSCHVSFSQFSRFPLKASDLTRRYQKMRNRNKLTLCRITLMQYGNSVYRKSIYLNEILVLARLNELLLAESICWNSYYTNPNYIREVQINRVLL